MRAAHVADFGLGYCGVGSLRRQVGLQALGRRLDVLHLVEREAVVQPGVGLAEVRLLWLHAAITRGGYTRWLHAAVPCFHTLNEEGSRAAAPKYSLNRFAHSAHSRFSLAAAPAVLGRRCSISSCPVWSRAGAPSPKSARASSLTH